MMKEAPLYKKLPQNKVQCQICPRYCTLRLGQRSFCGLYVNRGGTLFFESYGAVIGCFPTNYGNMFFHPKKQLLQVNLPGCCNGCDFCWYSDYIGKKIENVLPYEKNKPFAVVAELDPLSGAPKMPKSYRYISPEQIIEIALHTYHRLLNDEYCYGLNFSSVEPPICLSWVVEASKLCHDKEGVTLLSTAGLLSSQTVKTLASHLDSVRISFKSSGDNQFYRKHIGPSSKFVFDSAKLFKEKGVFVQIINTFSVQDPLSNFEKWSRWIVENLGENTPVVANPIQPIPPETTPEFFSKIEKIAKVSGIRFFYLDLEGGLKAYCPECQTLLMKKELTKTTTYHLGMNLFDSPTPALHVPVVRVELNLDKGNRCPKCGTPTPIIT